MKTRCDLVSIHENLKNRLVSKTQPLKAEPAELNGQLQRC